MKSKKGRIIIIILCVLFIALSVGFFMMTGETPAHTAPSASGTDTPETLVTLSTAPIETSPTVPAGVPDRVISTTPPQDDSQTTEPPLDTDAETSTYTDTTADSTNPDDPSAPDIAEPAADNSPSRVQSASASAGTPPSTPSLPTLPTNGASTTPGRRSPRYSPARTWRSSTLKPA